MNIEDSNEISDYNQALQDSSSDPYLTNNFQSESDSEVDLNVSENKNSPFNAFPLSTYLDPDPLFEEHESSEDDMNSADPMYKELFDKLKIIVTDLAEGVKFDTPHGSVKITNDGNILLLQDDIWHPKEELFKVLKDNRKRKAVEQLASQSKLPNINNQVLVTNKTSKEGLEIQFPDSKAAHYLRYRNYLALMQRYGDFVELANGKKVLMVNKETGDLENNKFIESLHYDQTIKDRLSALTYEVMLKKESPKIKDVGVLEKRIYVTPVVQNENEDNMEM